MRTAYCPKSHTHLASESVGTPYGHVPGHQYHDVDVVVSHRKGKEAIRCHVVESWGSAQGYDEEHGRREVIGRGLTVDGACSDAIHAGKVAGMDEGQLIQAVTQARDEAEEAMEDEKEKEEDESLDDLRHFIRELAAGRDPGITQDEALAIIDDIIKRS